MNRLLTYAIVLSSFFGNAQFSAEIGSTLIKEDMTSWKDFKLENNLNLYLAPEVKVSYSKRKFYSSIQFALLMKDASFNHSDSYISASNASMTTYRTSLLRSYNLSYGYAHFAASCGYRLVNSDKFNFYVGGQIGFQRKVMDKSSDYYSRKVYTVTNYNTNAPATITTTTTESTEPFTLVSLKEKALVAGIECNFNYNLWKNLYVSYTISGLYISDKITDDDWYHNFDNPSIVSLKNTLAIGFIFSSRE